MRATTVNRSITGDMPGEIVNMGLASDGLDHIMDILSDLYSDRIMAMIREYTTNGLDAHAISGQTKPVEITLPSALNNNLTIRDYGKGMSKSTLMDIYSKYGASTKRDNDIEVGRLGLGAKSGFAYADQFTVNSIHDGHSCMLIMSRNDRGSAEMNIALESDTDEPSGVSVTIPIRPGDHYEARMAAYKFAKYAKPGTVSVNGEVNEEDEDRLELIPNVYRIDDYGNDKIVMGNVAYNIPSGEELFIREYATHVIAYVDMGEVDFTPSREELKLTNHTKKTLEGIRKSLADSVVKQIDDVSKATEALDIYKKFHRYCMYGTNTNLQNKFDDMIEKFFPKEKISIYHTPNSSFAGDTLSSVRSVDYVSPSIVDNYNNGYNSDKLVALKNFKGSKFSRSQYNKIVQVGHDWGKKVLVVFEDKDPESISLFKFQEIIDWEEFKSKHKNVTVKKTSTPAAGYEWYKIHNRAYGRLRYEDINLNTNGIYYVTPGQINYISRSEFPREDFKLIELPKNRVSALLKKNPKIKSLEEYVLNRRQQVTKHLKHVEKRGTFADNIDFVENVDYNKVDDPELKKIIRDRRRYVKWLKVSRYRINSTYFKSDYICDNYPLLIHWSQRSWMNDEIDHVTEYVNLMYDKKKEND